jgi:hypothetical protein
MPRPLVHLVNFNSPQWLSEPKGTELAQGKVTIADDKDPICIYCVGRRGETDIHSGCITEPGVVLYCSRFQSCYRRIISVIFESLLQNSAETKG